jgi:hypothetical protein
MAAVRLVTGGSKEARKKLERKRSAVMRSTQVLVSGVSLTACLFFASVASAADPPADSSNTNSANKTAGKSTTTSAKIEDAADQVARPDADKVEKQDGDDEVKRIALILNPLAAAIGRYSIQGEYIMAKHHAVTLNPFYAHAPVTVTVNGKDMDAGSLNGFGGELGYRFYTGSKGPNGFYVGPSVIFASYTQSGAAQVSVPSVPGATVTTKSSSDSFTSLGGAIDIGGQAVIGPGIVVGGGFGLQYTKTSKDIATENLNLASAVIAGGGVRPRFLVGAGYAF